MDDTGHATARTDRTSGAAKLALLGHDIRAAVSDIIGGLRLIDQTGLDSTTRLQLERVRAAGEALARLLEQELPMLPGEAATGDALIGNVHLSRLLHDLQMRWQGRAQEKGLGFHLEVAEKVPKVLILDRIALERVLSTLLSNAIRYTDSGAVRFSVDLTSDGALRLVVQDDGPGFSAAALECLFQASGRPDGRGKPGLGLGMHLSKQMVTRLGGDVFVQNLAAGGARVTLVLPSISWSPLGADTGPPGALPDLSRVKILLANGSSTNRLMIGHMLAQMGAEYVLASDGVEAMNWLDREQFDLALLDIEMPTLSGLDVLRSIRSRSGSQGRMLVLAITAYVLRANREAIYAAGADGILAKPVLDIDTFALALQKLLHRQRTDQRPAESDSPLIDTDRFEHLLDIAGPAGGQELLSHLEADLRQVERGLVAGLAAASANEVRAQTHILIALAGAVGATLLQRRAEAMNAAAHLGDLAAVRSDSAATMRYLDHLIHFVASERATRRQSR